MSHSHEAPGLPQVTDEAGNSPPWLPKLGVALLVAVVLLVVVLQVRASRQPAAESDTGADAAAEDSNDATP